jgi:glycosyltransferase involved in cell wall biosynthesis
MSVAGGVRVSVIIPVRDDAARLKLCLDALAKQTLPEPFEVIVVDNGSSDMSGSVGDEYPNVRCLEEQRVGSYAARNRGVEEARGAILAFTDADCLPGPDWLERGCERLEAARVPAFVVGSVDVVVRDPMAPSPVELYELVHGYPQERYANSSFGATANLLVRREDFDRVGPFNPALQSSGDREWGERAGSRGMAAMYAPEVVVLHPARRSLSELRAKIRRVQLGRAQLRQVRLQPQRPSDVVLLALVPPIRTIARHLSDVRPATWRHRMSYIAVTLAAHYAMVYYRVASVLHVSARRERGAGASLAV